MRGLGWAMAPALLSQPQGPYKGYDIPKGLAPHNFWANWWGWYWWAIVALIGLSVISYFVATAHRRRRPLRGIE